MCVLRFGVDLRLRDLLVTSGQAAENVRRALRLAPRGGEMRALHHVLGHRDDLLAYENAEQPNQCHHRRRRRAIEDRRAYRPSRAPSYACTGCSASWSFEVRCLALCTMV